MLARGQVSAPAVVRETTTELTSNAHNALALRSRSAAYYVTNDPDQGKRDAEEVERLLTSAGNADEYEAYQLQLGPYSVEKTRLKSAL